MHSGKLLLDIYILNSSATTSDRNIAILAKMSCLPTATAAGASEAAFRNFKSNLRMAKTWNLGIQRCSAEAVLEETQKCASTQLGAVRTLPKASANLPSSFGYLLSNAVQLTHYHRY
uniref:SCP domain-containing protein n=2 Tax=Panagrellus redivivus TaxID=6233 RepID=A0A7E4US25_PANRE